MKTPLVVLIFTWLRFDLSHQDLDAYSDEELRYAGAPSGWDEPRLNEVPPLYAPNQYKPNDYHDNEEDHPPAAGATRGESFVSQAMFVWRRETLEVCVGLNLFVREEHRTLDVCLRGSLQCVMVVVIAVQSVSPI